MTTQRTWRWLVLFLLVDLVLVVVMFRHVSGDADDATANPTAPGPVDSSEPVAPATPTAAGLVEATDDVVVWGERGTCSAGTPVVLARDVDGVRDELDPGMTELLRIDVNDAGDVYVIGADAQCQPVELLLSEGATDWVDPPGPIRRWHLTSGAGATVTTPVGDVDPGCAPVSFVSDGTEGLVACGNGAIRTSDDDGATWEGEVVLEGLRSAVRSDDGAWALAPADDCAVASYRVDAAEAGVTGCVTTEAGDGLVLLAASGDGYVAVVADRLLRSSDGSSWEPLPAP
ncbi:hypothetical protein [Aeromicrobium sp. Sec7.5]|uniref:hypothetical protein n=1 Tax=Aeromicrobium sp. Sec7.5 TaxID=3121276 RepID=UPI002FE4BAFD